MLLRQARESSTRPCSATSARGGELIPLVGGDAGDVDRARMALALITKRFFHIGPLGSGHVMKLTANLGDGAYLRALAEGLALGAQEGRSIERMLAVLGGGATVSPYIAMKTPVLNGTHADIDSRKPCAS
jgi:3-hydroxyisobutyrate dehydrogenase-like beta-hydroxyacid dehydrogenase